MHRDIQRNTRIKNNGAPARARPKQSAQQQPRKPWQEIRRLREITGKLDREELLESSENFGEFRGTSGNFGELRETSEPRGTSGNFGELRGKTIFDKIHPEKLRGISGTLVLS